LPGNWQADSIPESVRKIGDLWVQNQESVLLQAPSAIIPFEYNYLINPSHPDFEKLVIHSPKKFYFDPRLLQKNKG
jgi:RES domain-containing protein